MNTISHKRYPHLAVIIMAGALLTACDDDDDDSSPLEPVMQTYQVEVVNLTHNQPLSPLAALVHESSIQAWELGSAAIEPLEVLAESGDNSQLLAVDGLTMSVSGMGVIGPGATDSMMVSYPETAGQRLTLATMLVNTNDAFTGLNSWDLDQLAAGETWSATAMAYDAGTEGNSESVASVPGPAAGGAGFDAARDDVDRVFVHPGVISADDGLSTSALDASHRFDNPVMGITITRIE